MASAASLNRKTSKSSSAASYADDDTDDDPKQNRKIFREMMSSINAEIARLSCLLGAERISRLCMHFSVLAITLMWSLAVLRFSCVLLVESAVHEIESNDIMLEREREREEQKKDLKLNDKERHKCR
jgi:hypothetical protein